MDAYVQEDNVALSRIPPPKAVVDMEDEAIGLQRQVDPVEAAMTWTYTFRQCDRFYVAPWGHLELGLETSMGYTRNQVPVLVRFAAGGAAPRNGRTHMILRLVGPPPERPG